MTVSLAARPIGGPTSTVVDLTITVTAGGFTLPPTSYAIYWTDSTGDAPDLVVDTTDTTITRRHVYAIGTYDIAVIVTDAVGGGDPFDDGHFGFIANYQAYVNYGDVSGRTRRSVVGFEV